MDTVLSGISLRTDEFSKAFQQIYFNGSVQLFNFFVVSSMVFGFTRFLIHANWMDEYLADGMTVCACLPMSVNLVIVLTASADGDEASAVFNTTFSNVVGIFLSPALILGYLGSKADIKLGQVFYKLTLKVIVPLVIGQVIQKIFPRVLDFCKGHKWHLKKGQETCLVFIVYTVFCQTFDSRKNRAAIPLRDIFLMVFFQLLLLLSFMAASWYLMGTVFPNRPRMRVMSIFGCPSKTIALGIPVINSIYAGNPYLGLYALPILIWHPMQVVVGSLAGPYLVRYVREELARLEQEEEQEKDTAKQLQEGTGAVSVEP
jgi:solute carrier family 10 (sodium/bile acid cotransporter), member 7